MVGIFYAWNFFKKQLKDFAGCNTLIFQQSL